MKKYKLFFACLIATLFLNIDGLSAQPTTPNKPGTGNHGCWPPPCIPIDGGISLLIAAGVAYGGRKMHNSRKKTLKETE